MSTDVMESDKALGLGILLGALAAVSAFASVTSPGTEIGAWGFAGAMVFGGLLIAVLHGYE